MIDEFDPSAYQNLPRLSPNAAMVLARNLLAVVPDPTSERVREAANRVQIDLHTLEAAIGKRKTLASELTLQQEAELDEFVDGLWHDLHARLEHWSTFERPGLAVLASMNQGDYKRLVERADLASEIMQMLFGRSGITFVSRSYREQAAAMGRILAAIEKYDLDEKLAALVGPELLPILRDAQTCYTQMVRAREEREKNLGTSLRELAGQMRWRINLYVVHVLSLLDRKQLQTVEIVRTSLQPILDFRRSMRVRGDGSDSGEWTFESPRWTP